MTRLADERGMTVLEVVVASALSLAVLLVALQFFDSAVARTVDVQRSTIQQADGRLAVHALVRELRQAYRGELELPPVDVATPTALTFYSPDAGTPMRMRKLVYEIADGALQRRVAWSTTDEAPWSFGPLGPPVELLEVGPSSAFAYRKENRVPTSDPAAVREVEIDLRGTADAPAFKTAVRLRSVT